MTDETFGPIDNFADAVSDGDSESVLRIWRTNPDLPRLLSERGLTISNYVFDAVTSDQLSVLEALVELGADINWRSDSDEKGHLWRTLAFGAMKCFHWLIDHNVEINVETPNAIRCPALEHACRKGRLDLVKLLVAKGAVTNYQWKNVDQPMGNPLTVAVKNGHEDIVDYLRSIGTPDPRRPNLEGFESTDPLSLHLAQNFGIPDELEIGQVVPSDPPISIVVVRTNRHNILVTRGMSMAPVTQNDGSQQYVELMMELPKDWSLDLDSADPRTLWAISCLQQMAIFPHETGLPFSFYVMFPNGSPPTPIIDGYEYAGEMAIEVMEDYATYVDGNNNEVKLYHVLPLYPEEFELVEESGVAELLERFEDIGIGHHVDLGRPNAATWYEST